jgi:hypothetical protein
MGVTNGPVVGTSERLFNQKYRAINAYSAKLGTGRDPGLAPVLRSEYASTKSVSEMKAHGFIAECALYMILKPLEHLTNRLFRGANPAAKP